MNKPLLQVGDRVTNDRGWYGTIQRIENFTSGLGEPGLYYWVHWRERATNPDKYIAKHPEIGHLIHQIKRLPP